MSMRARRDREYGLVTMYHVHTEEQWDVQAALFYGNLLYFFDFLNTFQVEESAYFATLDFACHVAAFAWPVTISPVTGRFN